MNCDRCIHLCDGESCQILSRQGFEGPCKFKQTNAIDYLNGLLDMLTYNKKNPNTVAELNVEIKEFRKRHNLQKYRKERGPLVGLSEAYWEDTHRGDRGGQSENEVNAGAKQKMKDNRPQECKLNKAEKQEIYDTTKEWEEEHGKLEKLSRSPLTRNKVDSYTGEKIE